MQKTCWIKICVFLVLMISFQLPSHAQSKKYFVITGKIVPEESGNGSGIIEITKNDKDKSTIEIPKSGRFRLELDFFNEFSLNFKYPGHFNKIILVTTQIPQDVWERDNDFPAFAIIVQLFKEFEGIDKSFALKPVAKIFYGKDIDNFDKESYFSDIQVLEQIATAKSQSNQVQKEAQSISKENAQDLAAKQRNYDQLIKEADTEYQRGEYQMALLKYQDAKNLFPDRAYPTDRVAELQDLVKALENAEKQKAELEEKYKNAIARGNQFFEQKQYMEAKPNYQEALQYKPGDVFSSRRINEIDQLLAQLEKQKRYKDLIDQADKNYQSKNYDQAISFYNQAKQVLPEENYPDSQISRINLEKQEQAKLDQLEKDFNQIMQTAGNSARQKDYLQALNFYQKALELKPDNQLAIDKIAEMNKAIADLENDKKYLQAIQLADQALASNDLERAKAQYQEAIRFKADETYPKNKLAEISVAETNKIKFEGLVSNAEKAFSDKNFEEALNYFNQALTIKPQDKSVLKRIEDIQAILKQQLADKEYTDLIARADLSFESNDFITAKTGYQSALSIKPNDPTAKDKLGKTEAKLAEIARLAQAYNKAIDQANAQLTAKKYPEAKEKYQEALQYLPDSDYPKQQIAKIDQVLAEQQSAEETNKKYTQFIKDAETAFKQKKLKEARDLFQNGSNLKPNEPLPPLRIAEIDKMLAQLEETAKLKAIEDAQRLAKQKADRQQYENEIAAGDKAFTAKEYKTARLHYTSALTVFSNEKYPKDQIAKIDELLLQEEMNKSVAQRKAAQDSLMKVKNQLFDAALASAKEHEQNNRYNQAIEKYNEAISIKPEQKPTIQKYIKEIEDRIQLLAKRDQDYQVVIKLADDYFSKSNLENALTQYKKASTIKPDEEYPKTQINLIESQLVAHEESYLAAIKNGDQAFDASDWANAKTAYTSALDIKPKEQYPLNRLKEVNQKISEANLAAIKNDAENKAYKEAIEKAQNLLDQDQLTSSRTQFQVAQTLKPNEKLPAEKIAEIDALLEKRNNDRLAQAQRELDEKYRQAISVADVSYNDKSYSTAKIQYQQALLIKPEESYPKDQLALIDKILSEAKDTEKVVVKQTPKPIINPEETIQATESRALAFQAVTDYDEAVKKADESFGIKDYSVARFYYYKASDIKPAEDYPKKQLEQIRKLIDSQLSSGDITAYNQAITQADNAFASKNYTVAKFFYYKALGIKSWEQYPKDRINEILALTHSLLSEKEEKEYRDLIAKADEAFFAKEISIARFYYNKASAMKKDEEYPKIKLKDIKVLIEQDQIDQANQEYQRIVEAGDEALKSENYSMARFNYNKALSMKPGEKYPKDQLKLIKEALDKKSN